jgi:hypothetical protein
MSALGHERTSRHVRFTSVIPLKADIHQRGLPVRLVPVTDIAYFWHRELAQAIADAVHASGQGWVVSSLGRFGSKACQIPSGKAGAFDGIGENPVFGQGELSVNRKEACAFCQLTGFQGSLMIAATSDHRNGGPS